METQETHVENYHIFDENNKNNKVKKAVQSEFVVNEEENVKKISGRDESIKL